MFWIKMERPEIECQEWYNSPHIASYGVEKTHQDTIMKFALGKNYG